MALAALAVAASLCAAAPAALPLCGGEGDANDWLTAGCAVHSSLTQAALPDGSTACKSLLIARPFLSRCL